MSGLTRRAAGGGSAAAPALTPPHRNVNGRVSAERSGRIGGVNLSQVAQHFLAGIGDQPIHFDEIPRGLIE